MLWQTMFLQYTKNIKEFVTPEKAKNSTYSSFVLPDDVSYPTGQLKNAPVTSDQLIIDSDATRYEKSNSDTTDQFKRDVVSDGKYHTDAWCLEQRKGKLSVKSLKLTKPVKIKVETDKVDECQNVYGCDDCGKVYSQRSSWKRHLKSHQPGVQRCGPCSMYFDSVEQLESHNKKFHSSSYACTICGSPVRRKACLRKHMLRVHPEKCNAKYSCPRSPCKAVFDSEEMFKDHLNIHDGQKPYSCSWCSKSFATRSSIRLHENNHSNERKSSQCEDCGKTFQSPGALHNHKVSIHQNKRFKCEKCAKVFIYRSGYCKHLISHKKEKSTSKTVETAPVVRDIKCPDVIKKIYDSKAENVPAVVLGGDSSENSVESTTRNDQNLTNQGDQIVVAENQAVERINQVEIGDMPQVGVPQVQTSLLSGQEITGLPLTAVQLDASGQVMWLCRT